MPDDATNHRAERTLRDVTLGDWSVLIDGVADDLNDVYASGLSEGLRLTGMGVDLDRVNTRAVDWARTSAASLVTQIEENTRDMLRSTVATGIEKGWSAKRLAEEIAQSPAFGDDRAMLIARTEIIRANNQGNAAGYKDAKASGVNVMKEWMTAGDDLVSEGCQDNEDEGPIDLEDDFPSGDSEPPAHPNCRCALVPHLPDESSDEEE
jgi:SPP1 gp7 family putative phage head morphogenesis protein